MRIREAKLEDEELIYRWSNDPLVRTASYHQEPIDFKAHQKWFRTKLKSSRSYLLICSIQEKPAGLVRFEIADDHWVIGVLIDVSFRGKGLSSEAISKGTQIVRIGSDLPVFAYIKKSNFASIKAFEKAGFKLEKELIVESVPSYLYVWK